MRLFGPAGENAPERVPPRGWRNWLGLAGFIGIWRLTGWLGSIVTESSVDEWYRWLEKPSFNPPNWVFAPVWTALYIMMGVAAWIVWRRRGFFEGRTALRLFGTQLLLNLLWSFLFFGLRQPAVAFFEIILLIVGIVATIVAFRRVDKYAELLMVPYLMWVLFAAALNGAIWYLN